MTPYDDIINLPHPEPKRHRRMARADRAAQFAPFEAGIHFDFQPPALQVSLDDGRGLEGQGVLHIEISMHLPPEIGILANDIAGDDGIFAHDHRAFGDDTALERTVDTDIVGGIDIAADDGDAG